MWKLTSFRATTPPNRRVTLSTSRIRLRLAVGVPACAGGWVLMSDMSGALLERLELLVGLLRPDRTPGWQQALRAEDGQRHQRQAEHQHAPVLELAEPLREVGDDDAADDRTPAVALAADDDRGDEQDGQQQREAVRGDEALLAREQRAGEATDEGAHRERQELEPEGRHAHQLGGVLVLAGGLPGPSHAAVLDQLVEEHHDDDHQECEPVVGDLVADAELQERGLVVQVDHRWTGGPVEARHVNSEMLGGRGTSVIPAAPPSQAELT